MKRVTISVTFDCDEQTAKMAEDLSLDKLPSAYAMHHFATRSEAGSLYTTIETKELYHVQVPMGESTFPNALKHGKITTEGFLALNGSPHSYTRGEAVKKAIFFKGKIVKVE